MNKNDKVEIINTGDIWEHKTGKVVAEGDELITVDGEDLTEVTVKVNFEGDDREEKYVMQIFPRKNLKLQQENENLNEDLSIKNEDEDIIKPYVVFEDIDGNEVPSWIFVSRIAAAENVDEDAVLELAKKGNYKIFCLSCGLDDKDIIADKSITKEDIWNDYGDYVLGPATLYEVE